MTLEPRPEMTPAAERAAARKAHAQDRLAEARERLAASQGPTVPEYRPAQRAVAGPERGESR